MDWSEAIGAVTRRVEQVERDGRAARRVVAERSYDTSVADLWDALTTAERLVCWLSPLEGELRLGGRYQLKGNASGTITHCAPPAKVGPSQVGQVGQFGQVGLSHLSLTWELEGETSWVDVRLTADADRVRLRLEHVTHVSAALWTKFGPGGVGVGWDLMLFALGEHVAGAPPVDPRASVAWLGSDEGRRFIAASTNDWCSAAVAAAGGEEPA